MHRTGTRSRLTGGMAVARAACIAIAGCSSSTATYLPPTATAGGTGNPTAAGTAAPTAAPSDTAAPAATSRAAMCTGNADNKAFIAEAAAKVAFDVYCAVLPSYGWLQSGEYKLPDGGYVQLEYRDLAGPHFTVQQGNICPIVCAGSGIYIGPTAFGDKSGRLYTFGEVPLMGATYILRVGPEGDPDYLMQGQRMTREQFVALAAGLRKVPKS
jgi:hypothetical protein